MDPLSLLVATNPLGLILKQPAGSEYKMFTTVTLRATDLCREGVVQEPCNWTISFPFGHGLQLMLSDRVPYSLSSKMGITPFRIFMNPAVPIGTAQSQTIREISKLIVIRYFLGTVEPFPNQAQWPGVEALPAMRRANPDSWGQEVKLHTMQFHSFSTEPRERHAARPRASASRHAPNFLTCVKQSIEAFNPSSYVGF
ncbi:hypothetical protein CALCODRAFT_16030 [Calocera cornea HHB12733]|uniref:Uncharacterized protein n=1 Tax=Calocera cornea HHB12733 TaxID=1353952 RepID=A0A165E8T7_9BASI|nr:hypothetical protein CALCODRAFT_16030 [Calocera cornea HHB12733]